MSKGIGVWAVVIALAVIVASVACGQATPTAAPATPAATATPAPAPIELTFSTYMPTSYYIMRISEQWVKDLEQASNGRLKINFFHSAQLFGGKEELPALQRGDIDISSPPDVYHSGTIKEAAVGGLPFLWKDIDDQWGSLSAGLWDQGLTQKWAELDIVVLAAAPAGLYQFGTVDKPVRTPADVEGLVWGVSGATHGKGVEALGGSPSFLSSGELYTALQRGTIDGTTRPLITFGGRKLYEVAKYVTIANFAAVSVVLSMNKAKWDSLPPDLQQLLRDQAKVWAEAQYKGGIQDDIDQIKLLTEKGMEIIYLSDTELAAFKENMPGVYDWWLGEVPGGQKYLDWINAH